MLFIPINNSLFIIDERCKFCQEGGFFMKVFRNIVLITFIISGLIFARTERSISKSEVKHFKVKNQHYWVKDHADEDKGQLDRKRSHKRRRKIRKPVKGLR